MTGQLHIRARKFLQEFFNDEDLTNFCFDYFPQVYSDFTQGMPKSQKVRMLVEHNQRRDRFDELLAALERERPKSYPEHFAEQPHLIDPEPQPEKEIKRHPHQIFISHAHQDAEFAQRLATNLRENGWETWRALDNIRPGEKWVEVINRGLAESGVFVLLLTPDAVASRWVRSEMNAAIGMEHREEIRLLPLKVKPADAPVLWQTYQWITFDGNYKAGLSALLRELDPRKVAPIDPIEDVGWNSPIWEILGLDFKTNTNSTKALGERIKTLPYWFYAGVGFILLTVLLSIFWPDRNNDSIVEPTEVAEVSVVTTEEPKPTNTPQPITSETPTNEPLKFTPTVKPAETATTTLTPSATLTPRQIPSATATTAIGDPNLPPLDARLGDEWIRPKDGMVMVYVPPPDSPFVLWVGENAPSEGYWIDKYEISNEQYALCVNDGACSPSDYVNDSRFNSNNNPVVGVSWSDANDYCSWVGGKLPSEAEWEYSVVSESLNSFPWGIVPNISYGSFVNSCDINCNLGWNNRALNDGYQYSSPVDSFPDGSSWVGAFNLIGNVWEWVSTVNGEKRVVRGGAFTTGITGAGNDRVYVSSEYSIYDVGFRVVMHPSR